MAKEIRLIGGAWRVIEGQNVRSYATYMNAVAGGKSLEDDPLMTSDDIQAQLAAMGGAGR